VLASSLSPKPGVLEQASVGQAQGQVQIAPHLPVLLGE
jgi:hypothetical protein